MPSTAPVRRIVLLLALLSACQQVPTMSGGPMPGKGTDRGVDLDALFQPPTAAEIAEVEAEWAARDVSAREVVAEGAFPMAFAGGPGTAHVFSHRVDGHRHYGATLVPDGAPPGSLPVVVVAHSGESGVHLADVAARLALMGEEARSFAYVVPSFRSEPLTVAGARYLSGGAPSPWDGDVDDALAFLNVALEHTPAADRERIGVLGTSRGGTVALLMAIRDPRISVVAEMSAPTDFFAPWVRGLVEEALAGTPRPLPGLRAIDEQFIQPLAKGLITPEDFRSELVRRSPLLWASRLPSVQVHHGTADPVVPLAQAHALISALEGLPRESRRDEFHLYPGLGHATLAFDHAATIAFFARLRR